MNDLALVAPRRVTEAEALARCEYFTSVQLWPVQRFLNPERWLDNFRGDERDYAVQLLNGFLFYSEAMVKQLFASAFQNLSRIAVLADRPDEPFITLLSHWRQFCDSAIITYVTGEIESPTDSGPIFARTARKYLGFPERQIYSPSDALQTLVDHGPRPTIFVDDFVGSGNQFVTTWTRNYNLRDNVGTSFEKISAIQSDLSVYYCTVISTETGLEAISTTCPAVKVSAAHVIPDRYSALTRDSMFWPAEMRDGAVDFLKSVSIRAGIPDTNGFDTADWQGYQRLGLAIAFQHGVPDATLGLIRWKSADWHPLVVEA